MQPDVPVGAATERAIVAALGDAGVMAEAIGPPNDDGRADEASRLRQAALWGALGLSAIMALIVALAARTLTGRRRDYIAVMADLGGTSAQTGVQVADEIGGAGFLAGVAGAACAGAGALALGSIVYPALSGPALWRALAPADIAPLLAAPFLAAMAASSGARLAANTFFARAARLG